MKFLGYIACALLAMLAVSIIVLCAASIVDAYRTGGIQEAAVLAATEAVLGLALLVFIVNLVHLP